MMILTSALESQLQRMRNEWRNVRIIRKPFELADVIDACQAAAANRPLRQRDDMESFWRTSLTHGAKSGVVVRRVGNELELVTKFGYAPGAVEQWYPMPLNQPYPICIAVRHERPVWMASLTGNDDYPLLAAIWQQHHTRALAVAPIVRGGEVIGGVGWTFREPQRFNEAEQRTWLAIADATAALIGSGMATHATKQAGA
jgi:GAF domain-containing protein